MQEKKGKRIAFGVLWLSLFTVALYYGQPIFFLFALLAAHSLYRAFAKPRPKPYDYLERMQNSAVGVLGSYHIDGPSEEPSFGLFIELDGQQIFVDIRQDEYVERRISHAKRLAYCTAELEHSLRLFRQENPRFANRKVELIGLHADPDQGEVFWEPDGHTRLHGTDFVD